MPPCLLAAPGRANQFRRPGSRTMRRCSARVLSADGLLDDVAFSGHFDLSPVQILTLKLDLLPGQVKVVAPALRDPNQQLTQ